MSELVPATRGGHVTATRTTDTSASPTPRRADARRNAAAILDAATECLARDPDVSIQEIAQAAGVGRVTLYGHYPSRAALIESVVDRAIRRTEADLADLDLTGDARDALRRLMAVSWDLTHRFGALVVAAQRALPPERVHALHEAPAARARLLVLRGRRQGAFRTDMPVAWQTRTLQSILHGGVDAVYRGEVRADQARALVADTALAVLSPSA